MDLHSNSSSLISTWRHNTNNILILNDQGQIDIYPALTSNEWNISMPALHFHSKPWLMGEITVIILWNGANNDHIVLLKNRGDSTARLIRLPHVVSSEEKSTPAWRDPLHAVPHRNCENSVFVHHMLHIYRLTGCASLAHLPLSQQNHIVNRIMLFKSINNYSIFFSWLPSILSQF